MVRCLLLLMVVGLLAGVGHAAPPALLRLPAEEGAAKKAQREWGEVLGVAGVEENSLGMRLVVIPPGQFTMGPNGSTYRVRLARPFLMGATEVTLGEYRRFRAGHTVEGAGEEFNADDRPAAMVSWEEARAFCEWLSVQPSEKEAGRVYALPSEAQWEWAARAGTVTTRYFGDDAKGQEAYSWFNSTYTPNPKHEAEGRGRQSVGRLKPNAWGLYDMLGNVWEWCDDRVVNQATGETRDPVMRGGSWRSGAFHCTAVAHDPGSVGLRADNVGFRVVCWVRGEE